MQKLAVIRRKDQEGVKNAAVNVNQVRYVFSQGSGSYITFEDEHDGSSTGVTPIGMASPDSVEEVIRRLNQPYWIDIRFRVGGLLLSAVGVIITIALTSN